MADPTVSITQKVPVVGTLRSYTTEEEKKSLLLANPSQKAIKMLPTVPNLYIDLFLAHCEKGKALSLTSVVLSRR